MRVLYIFLQQVNGIDITVAPHDQAVALLTGIRGEISLVVSREHGPSPLASSPHSAADLPEVTSRSAVSGAEDVLLQIVEDTDAKVSPNRTASDRPPESDRLADEAPTSTSLADPHVAENPSADSDDSRPLPQLPQAEKDTAQPAQGAAESAGGVKETSSAYSDRLSMQAALAAAISEFGLDPPEFEDPSTTSEVVGLEGAVGGVGAETGRSESSRGVRRMIVDELLGSMELL